MLTTDRDGNPWKVYSNGRMLCARSKPYHSAFDPGNRDTDGTCDCVNREGATIASFTMRFEED